MIKSTSPKVFRGIIAFSNIAAVQETYGEEDEDTNNEAKSLTQVSGSKLSSQTHQPVMMFKGSPQ